MTEATEIETVTVEFEELKANLHHYYELKKTKRLEITKEGKIYAVVGRWNAGERRWFYPNWPEILYELFPEPFDPEDEEPGRRRVDEEKGHRPIYMPTRLLSSNL